ncbi:MAG: DUF5721 family protein [Roseburia sp.]|nr:DUF5721 family protein [Roseburia sp.]
MTALQIKVTKNFMNTLLLSEQFDSFLVEEAAVTTFNAFHIDGHIVGEFFDSDERSALAPLSAWKDIRPICLQLIKGRRAPVSMRIVLQAPPALLEKIAADEACEVDAHLIRSLVLNIRYENGRVSCVTGSSLTTFIPDKSVDRVWDAYIRRFFSALPLDFEEA